MPPRTLSSTRSAKRRSSSRAMPGRAEADVVLLGLLGEEAPARGLRRRARRAARARGAPTRSIAGALDELDERVVVDRAGGGDDDVGGHVAAGVEGRAARRRRAPADDVGAADDRAAQRMVAEDGLAEDVEDLVLRVVLVHRDLLEDDLALLRRARRRSNARAPDHVGHDVEGALEVAVEHARVDRRRLLARAGVELGAHGVEELVDLQRPVARRAAEEHVLDQVAEARPRARPRRPSRCRSRARGRRSGRSASAR